MGTESKNIIPLTRGKFALVDDDDFKYLSQWNWNYASSGYAARGEGGNTILMHRVVNKTPKGIQTDHINRNKLDNRKSNLRNCSSSLNQLNMGLRARNTSGYTGVCWRNDRRKWKASIKVNGNVIYLGLFSNPEDAGAVYNKKWEEVML